VVIGIDLANVEPPTPSDAATDTSVTSTTV
jgi:hypothetical protein